MLFGAGMLLVGELVAFLLAVFHRDLFTADRRLYCVVCERWWPALPAVWRHILLRFHALTWRHRRNLRRWRLTHAYEREPILDVPKEWGNHD